MYISDKRIEIGNFIFFIIGNLPQDMNEEKCLPFEGLLPLDRYVLHLVSQHQVKYEPCLNIIFEVTGFLRLRTS